MKKVFIITLFLFMVSARLVYAESDYVLPYPASMPGSKFYILQEIKNNLMKYWYFGNFGQFTYNLNQADKFIVEAKTAVVSTEARRIKILNLVSTTSKQ